MENPRPSFSLNNPHIMPFILSYTIIHHTLDTKSVPKSLIATKPAVATPISLPIKAKQPPTLPIPLKHENKYIDPSHKQYPPPNSQAKSLSAHKVHESEPNTPILHLAWDT